MLRGSVRPGVMEAEGHRDRGLESCLFVWCNCTRGRASIDDRIEDLWRDWAEEPLRNWAGVVCLSDLVTVRVGGL